MSIRWVQFSILLLDWSTSVPGRNECGHSEKVLENDAVPLRQVNTGDQQRLGDHRSQMLGKIGESSLRIARRMLADDLGRFLSGTLHSCPPYLTSGKNASLVSVVILSQTMNVVAILVLIMAILLGWNWVRSREHRAQRVSLAKISSTNLRWQLRDSSSNIEEYHPVIAGNRNRFLKRVASRCISRCGRSGLPLSVALVSLPERNVAAFRDLCLVVEADWREISFGFDKGSSDTVPT